MTSETEMEALSDKLFTIFQECANGRPINGGDLEVIEDAAAALSRAPEVLTDVFERPFDGDDDPRLRAARVLTRREAEAVLEHAGDLVAALSGGALRLAISHIEHMTNWIALTNRGEARGTYSFEALGEDMPGIKAALSPPSTGGVGEALIMRVGERIADEVEKVAGGRQSNCEQAARDIVGWLHPSPEMGEISREELEASLNKALRLQVDTLIGEIRYLVPQNYGGWDYHGRHWTDRIAKRATDEILKLKENGLSREGLGGSARASRGAAGPSDCAEGDARLSDGGRV